MTGYCQIGPIDIAASELMDEMKFDDAASIDELNHQLSILTTHKLAKDVQGLSRWGELVWIEGGTTLVDNLNFVHRGLYKMGTVGIGIENADYALVHIPCRNYGNSDEDARLRMDYTTGVNDGTYLNSSYDETSLIDVYSEDFSAYDTTNIWYPLNSSGITSHTISGIGGKLEFEGKASTGGVTGGMITQSRASIYTNFICDFDLEWDAVLPSGYNSFGVIFSESTNNSWSNFHTIRSNTNYFRIELRGTATAANIVVTKVVNGHVTDIKTVALTSGQKTPTFRFKYYKDGSGEVWCNKSGSAITESVAAGDTKILSRTQLGLTFKDYVYMAYDFTTNYATATQTYRTDGISFTRYEDSETQNIVTIPYNATLKNSGDFTSVTRSSEYGNLTCLVNPISEPEFTMDMDKMHSEGVQLYHTLNSVSTRIYNTDTIINPSGFIIKNGIIKLVVNDDALDFYYWGGSSYTLLNSFDLGGTISYVKALNIGNYMGRVQIDDTIVTMRFGAPYFWIEHPDTDISYTHNDLYLHDNTTTSYSTAGADITMQDVSYCKSFSGYSNILTQNQATCGEDGTITGFSAENNQSYVNHCHPYQHYPCSNGTTGLFAARGDTTLAVNTTTTYVYQGTKSLKCTAGGTNKLGFKLSPSPIGAGSGLDWSAMCVAWLPNGITFRFGDGASTYTEITGADDWEIIYVAGTWGSNDIVLESTTNPTAGKIMYLGLIHVESGVTSIDEEILYVYGQHAGEYRYGFDVDDVWYYTATSSTITRSTDVPPDIDRTHVLQFVTDGSGSGEGVSLTPKIAFRVGETYNTEWNVKIPLNKVMKITDGTTQVGSDIIGTGDWQTVTTAGAVWTDNELYFVTKNTDAITVKIADASCKWTHPCHDFIEHYVTGSTVDVTVQPEKSDILGTIMTTPHNVDYSTMSFSQLDDKGCERLYYNLANLMMLDIDECKNRIDEILTSLSGTSIDLYLLIQTNLDETNCGVYPDGTKKNFVTSVNMATGTDYSSNTTGVVGRQGTETVTSSTAQHYFGSRSIKCSTPGTYAREGIKSDDFNPVSPDTAYTFGARVMGGDAGWCWLYVFEYDSGNSLINAAHKAFLLSGSWTQQTMTFVTGSTTASVKVSVVTADTRSVEFYTDEIFLVELYNVLQHTTTGKNIAGGTGYSSNTTGFEAVHSGGGAETLTSSTAAAWTGTRSLKVSCPGSAEGEGVVVTDIYSWDVTPGVDHEISITTKGTDTGNMVLHILEYDAAMAPVTSTTHNFTLNSDFQPKTKTVTIDSDTRHVGIKVVTADTRAVDFYLDSVLCIPNGFVPENYGMSVVDGDLLSYFVTTIRANVVDLLETYPEVKGIVSDDYGIWPTYYTPLSTTEEQMLVTFCKDMQAVVHGARSTATWGISYVPIIGSTSYGWSNAKLDLLAPYCDYVMLEIYRLNNIMDDNLHTTQQHDWVRDTLEYHINLAGETPLMVYLSAFTLPDDIYDWDKIPMYDLERDVNIVSEYDEVIGYCYLDLLYLTYDARFPQYTVDEGDYCIRVETSGVDTEEGVKITATNMSTSIANSAQWRLKAPLDNDLHFLFGSGSTTDVTGTGDWQSVTKENVTPATTDLKFVTADKAYGTTFYIDKGMVETGASNHTWTETARSTSGIGLQIMKIDPDTIKVDSIPADDLTMIGKYDESQTGYNTSANLAQQCKCQTWQGVNLKKPGNR